MNSPIIVITSELAKIFGTHERTIAKLVVAGVIAKVRPGKFDLIDCTSRYVAWLRNAASQHNTFDDKKAALQALTALRDAQRFNIETKSRDYIKRSDAVEAATLAGSRAKQKLLELPLRLRQRIEDDFPTAFKTMKEAFSAEDAIDAVCCEILQEISDIKVEPVDA
jgi:phage terminase Nu1 subunit (DNA packaging protein)